MNNLKLAKDDLDNLIEEKCPHTGAILSRYTKGRRLGKVFYSITSGRIRRMSRSNQPQNKQKRCSQNNRQINPHQIKSQRKSIFTYNFQLTS